MKKLFFTFLALFFLYVHTGHNSVMAYSISNILSQNSHCWKVHNPIEQHKCCFISTDQSKTIQSDTVKTQVEKVKKQIFTIINLNNTVSQELQKQVLYQPHWPPQETQTNFYTSLTGIIKQIK